MKRLKDIPIGHYYIYEGYHVDYDTWYLRWSPDKVMSRNTLLIASKLLQRPNINYEAFIYGSEAVRRVMLDYSYHTNLYDLDCPVIPCKEICI